MRENGEREGLILPLGSYREAECLDKVRRGACGSKEEEASLAEKAGEQNEEPANWVSAGRQVLGVESR